MDTLKVLKIIIPEIEIMRGVKQGPYHHLDVLRHTFETIRQLENLIHELKKNKEIQDYLNEVISAGRKRYALIKLGALLHDIGKPYALRKENGKTKFHGHEKIGLEIAEQIAERLRLSNDELDALRKMVFWHLRPGYLADNEEITARATFRYFRDTAQEGVSILLLSIADQRATKGPLTVEESRIHHEKVALDLIKEYFKRKKEKKMPRIITGDNLIKKFQLEPSPLIGKILREIEELQAIGKITTKKQALDAARKLI
jgi:putative nucleotidyltransferase with HDIG domain